jgi:hypothetical protein
MKTASLFFASLLFCFLSACAFHGGNISTGYTPDCPVVKIATGKSSTFKLLGIGGNDKQALILEAKQDLYRNQPVTQKIKISNFSADFKTTFFLIFIKTQCTVSADVFDCNQKLDTAVATKAEANLISVNGFMQGDSVFLCS